MNEVRLSIQSVDISWQYKPLSIVVSIRVSSITVVAVGVGVGTIGTISHPGISLGLGLGISRPIKELVNKREGTIGNK